MRLVEGSKGTFPYHEGKHLIVALRQFVYVDESGTHDGSTRCLVAGYRGSPGQWKIFNKEWRAVLRRYGLPDFHSKVFFNRKIIPNPKKNPYLRWSDDKATDFLGELLMVIRHRRIHPVGCAVDIPAFEAYSYGERCVLVGYRTEKSRRKGRARPAPYHLAFRLMIGDALEGTHPDTDVHFVVAETEEYTQRAYESYRLTKEYGRTGRQTQLKSFASASAADVPSLQAADLFARQWYNTLVRGQARLNKENIQVMTQLTHRRRNMPVCDVPAIERLFDDAGITMATRERLRLIVEPS